MYSLEETYYLILQKADKIGSDFFQLPVILNRFRSATYEYLDAIKKVLEMNQGITDDIKPLIVPKRFPLLADADLGGMKGPLPSDYYYLASIKPIYLGNTTPRQTRVVRIGQDEIMKIDPFNKPTLEYPHVYQYENFINIQTNDVEEAIEVLILYIKKPVFANLNEPQVRIVNLPDNVIEKIIEITVKQLFASTADQRVQVPNSDF
jgi:hypothetical protein